MSATLTPPAILQESTTSASVQTRVCPFEGGLSRLPETVREEWQSLTASGVDPRQTPEYAESHLARPDVPRLPGLWLATSDAPGGQGVLLPKRLALPRPASWVRRELRGYWLAGNGAVAAGDEELTTLLDASGHAVREQGGDFLLLEDMELDSPLQRAADRLVQQGWRAYSPTGWQPRWRIQMPAAGDEYWAKFNSKRRGNLRRQQRKFGGTVVRVESVEQVEWFLQQATEVSKTTWQSRVLGQRVSGDDFERTSHELAARRGVLRSYVLMKDERPASFAMGQQYGGRFSLEEIGYDPVHAEWSPGMVLLCHMLDDLFAERTPAVFDFGGGDASYKRTLANHESVGGTVWLVAPGWSRRAALGVLEGGARVRAWGRRFVKWRAERATTQQVKSGVEVRPEEG
jgi:CelD/BcsL family acetyltransferase involved in cellulose biosynthesis